MPPSLNTWVNCVILSVLSLLMQLGEPFELDSDLVCSINLFDDCVCPNCIDQEDQDE